MQEIILTCCRIGVNALSNEFLTNACNEWRERLSEGDMHYYSLYFYSGIIYLHCVSKHAPTF